MAFRDANFTSQIISETIDSQEFKDYRQAIERMTDVCAKMAGSEHLDAVGISMTGEVNPIQGTVIDSIFFKEWNNKPLVSDLKEKLNCEVKLENDAVCAGLAEISNLTSHKHKNYTFISIGTGIGGVKLMKLSNSILVFPWDFGHMIVERNGAQCPCGQRGCLEMYASGSGIKAKYGKPLENIDDPQVWLDLISYMAQAITSYLAVNPTEAFMFGGGIIFKKPGIVDQIETKVREMATVSGRFPDFELARYQEEAQAFGMLQMMTSPLNLVNVNYY